MVHDGVLLLAHPPAPHRAGQNVREHDAQHDQKKQRGALEVGARQATRNESRDIVGERADQGDLAVIERDPQSHGDRRERDPYHMQPRHTPARALIDRRCLGGQLRKPRARRRLPASAHDPQHELIEIVPVPHVILEERALVPDLVLLDPFVIGRQRRPGRHRIERCIDVDPPSQPRRTPNRGEDALPALRENREDRLTEDRQRDHDGEAGRERDPQSLVRFV